MNIKKINEDLYVGPQIALTDLQKLKDMGVKSLVVARPDGEDAGQPAFATVAAAAQALDMGSALVPVKPTNISEGFVSQFAQSFEELPKPVFAYCRSGNRAARLWSLSEAKKKKTGNGEQDAPKKRWRLFG